jgi:hypothetical protein
MQTDIQSRKSRGRLGRDVQSKLGKTLQSYFDDVLKEGVPDRFKALLEQIEEQQEERGQQNGRQDNQRPEAELKDKESS